jgi:outer membrane protein OmpA-like peptidoglycan-associated protein
MTRRLAAGFTLALTFSVLMAYSAGCQEISGFQVTPAGNVWSITTRWDYRVRINGEYLGHTNRELREVYRRGDSVSGGWLVSGDARLLGATKKDGVPVAARLESSEPVEYFLSEDGTVMEAGDSYPRLRGFPTFPDGDIQPEEVWEAPLGVLVRGPKGENYVLPQFASYRYIGKKTYMGRDAHYFDVVWAVRYPGADPSASEFLISVEGSHKMGLVVDAETGAPMMARDALSERWVWADGDVEQRDGFALIFWDGVPPMDHEEIRQKFDSRFPGTAAQQEDDADNEGIIISEIPGGLSVTLRNLHFLPDLAEILPEDRGLLDELARIIENIPDRTILVRGHTADVGRPDDQYKLSEERAKSIAEELSSRGIDPRRLIYEGVGADEPTASNISEEGRRLNRRVELLILED